MNGLICKCGSILRYKVGDTIQNGAYRWHISTYCCNCGSATEIDGTGFEDIPTEVRQEIIGEYGEWEILAASQLSKINYLMKKLLVNCNITTKSGNPFMIYRGTKNQVFWVKGQLIEKGIPESALLVQPLSSL